MESAKIPADHWLTDYVNACGSKRSAAHRLGIPRGTLRRWLKEIDRAGVVHSAPKRVQAVKDNVQARGHGTATADALMGIFGYHRAGRGEKEYNDKGQELVDGGQCPADQYMAEMTCRGDDMTCARFPDEDFVVSKDIEDGKRGFGPDMAKRIRNSQTANGETKERVNAKGVHESRIGDEKARKSNTSKRIVVVSDLHCGHMVGLTPPGWWYSEHEALQREMWEWYENEMQTIGEVDACFVVGDTIDGKGGRSGGVEQLTNDMIAQTDMATACLKIIQTDKYFMVHGTPYHVGPDGEHMERLVARNLGGTISGHEWVSVNGCVFDLKHKVGSSGVSYGRHTAVAKEKLWNTLWNLRKMAPKANVILRGHVHYYLDCGGIGWRAMTLPALQGPGSFYGVEQCSGIVDFGFVVFDVDADGKFKWEVHEYNPKIGEPIARVL